MLPDHVQTFIDAEIAANRNDFSDLRAVILNGVAVVIGGRPHHDDATRPEGSGPDEEMARLAPDLTEP